MKARQNFRPDVNCWRAQYNFAVLPRRGIRSVIRVLLAILLTSGLFATSLQGQPTGAAIGPVTAQGVATGELLFGELNCVGCHRAEAVVKARLFSRQSPPLGEAGLRLTPQYLRAFLSNPFAEKPGTTMPDVLHALPPTQKAQAVDDLVHFLCWLSETNISNPLSANQAQISQGRVLYHQIGCVACHAPQEAAAAIASKSGAPANTGPFDKMSFEQSSVPLGNLAKKTTVRELANFLRNPLKGRPSGRMPSLNLNDAEATAIAMYLLRGQASSSNSAQPVKTSGLEYHYFEGDFSDTTKLEGAKPKTHGTIERFSLKPRQRTDNIGFRFSGLVNITKDGAYIFYTASDDGSRLYLDDKLVVENDGTHGTTEKKGKVQLTAGDHAIMVSYFNGGAEAALKVSYEGPGLAKQEIPAAALSHPARPMVPLEEENLVVNLDKANRGKNFFGSAGCAACHQLGSFAMSSTLNAKSFDEMDVEAVDNCLGAAAQKAPQYRLSDLQRGAILSTLAARKKLAQPMGEKEQVARSMAALNCFACHSRDGLGGPAPDRAEYFTIVGEADLGDEGRIPPALSGVGNKLRPEWLREVLLNKGTARPYMATRMPQFSAASVGTLATQFSQADANVAGALEIAPVEVKDAPIQDVNYGRKLVGIEGFSCISCHLFAQHKSLGIPAMDLSLMTRRLKKDWFHRYLLEPAVLRPGTRMPSFWPEGKSARQDILKGDPDRQINALWAYLERGKDGGLPPGLIQGKMELAAAKEAIVYRNFIQGAGVRGIGVGYPEKANIAFDANELRLALIWQGPFIDAARHRNGRGDGFEGPLGYNVIKMPAGAPFAILEAGSKWPEASGKKAGYQMRGYQLDAQRRPAFLYSFANIDVEDYVLPVKGELESFVRRTLTLRTEHPVENLWLRAWAGAKIETQGDGSFLAEGRIRLHFEGTGSGKAALRQSDGKWELLVPVRFHGRQAEIVEEVIW